MKKNDTLFMPLLSAYYFFYFALVGVYIIFMPKALADLQYSTFEIGVIYFAAPFMRFLLPFVFKSLVALTPKVYTYSLVLMLLSTLLFSYSISNFWLHLFSNLLFGATMGVSLPYVETIAISKLSKNRYGRARLWGSIGFIVIALWLGKMLSAPHETFTYLAAMAFFTLIFGILVLKYDDVSHPTAQENASFSLSKYWAFWLSIFLMQVSFGGFYNFFTIYETSRGVSLEMTSWMWSFGVICEIFMLYFQGPLLQRNLLNILQFATIITAVRWLMLYLFPDSIALTFASQSLHAISFALYHTTAITYVFSLYTQKKLAQQFFLGIAFGLGGSIGALLSGKIYGEHLFLVEAVIAFIAFVVLWLHQKRKQSIQ